MIRDSGTGPDRIQDLLSKSRTPLLLTGAVKISGQRTISGVANSPIPDRENKLITSEAMEKAIPLFLRIPILHTDHSERPAGFVTECHVVKAGDPILCTDHPDYDPHAKPGDTYFKAKIPEDGDTDDIWEKIQKGHYNKISIYGVRTTASDECKLAPHQRVSPCVTKAIRLWSFSLVGDNAINPGSYIKVAKSFSPDLCDEFEANTVELIKAAFPDVSMAPNADQQDQDFSGDIDESVKKADVVTKSELDPVVQDVTLMKGELADVKTGVDKILDFISKSSQDATSGDTTEEPVVEYITKANLETTLDLIVKAKIDLAVAEVKKAYDEKFAAMEKQMEAFGSETIRKGGRVVVLDGDGNSLGNMDNSFLSNFDALEA